MDTDPNRSPDEEAFLRQFMAGERAILRFILRYVPAVNDARDVLQETLVTLWASSGVPGRAGSRLPAMISWR